MRGYDRSLQWVLRHQTGTLMVAVLTLVLTVLLYIVVPKGFFPVQDTGIILGISAAPQNISFAAMNERQQALARELLKDPAVASLSTFIGVDGTNITMNSGRVLINLKPLAERGISATEVIRRLTPRLAGLEGITLYMQPVQDLTVEDRVSRTQYQYSLEDPNARELNEWTHKLVATLQKLPELSDVSSDLQDQGLQVMVTIDRATASRLGITPQMIDDTLYDAYGQRQVSTIFTQLNQYRVVQEVKPDFQQHPKDLKDIYIRSTGGGKVPLAAIAEIRSRRGRWPSATWGSFPPPPCRLTWRRGHRSGRRCRPSTPPRKSWACRPASRGAGRARPWPSRRRSRNEPLLILAALITVYIVLGVLYESYIHPITIISTLPSAGVGAILALLICRIDFSIIALIGVILLIGIVKKNGIMMVDFALRGRAGKASRRRKPSTRRACCASGPS